MRFLSILFLVIVAGCGPAKEVDLFPEVYTLDHKSGLHIQFYSAYYSDGTKTYISPFSSHQLPEDTEKVTCQLLLINFSGKAYEIYVQQHLRMVDKEFPVIHGDLLYSGAPYKNVVEVHGLLDSVRSNIVEVKVKQDSYHIMDQQVLHYVLGD